MCPLVSGSTDELPIYRETHHPPQWGNLSSKSIVQQRCSAQFTDLQQDVHPRRIVGCDRSALEAHHQVGGAVDDCLERDSHVEEVISMSFEGVGVLAGQGRGFEGAGPGATAESVERRGSNPGRCEGG